MQKTIIILAFLLALPMLVLSNEEGQNIADDHLAVEPLKGYFGIGMDATPFLNFLGNVANNTANNSLDFTDNTLYFRYFLFDNAAIRASFNIATSKSSVTHFVRDDHAFINDPLSNMQVEDRRIEFDMNYSIRAGYQYFFNPQNKLRGFAGADLGYAYSKMYYEYDYGNIMNELNPRPTTVFNWNTGGTHNPLQRRLENVDQLMHTLMAGGFTGVEYVLMQSFAIGLEVGLLYGLSIPGTQYQINELMSGSIHVEETIKTGGGNHIMTVETTKPYAYGNLYLIFHF